MDPLQTIRDQAREALADLPQAGAIGLAAILAGARAHALLEGLSSQAPLEAGALRELARELDQFEALIASHPGALDQALGRLVTVVVAAAAQVERVERAGGGGA